MDNCGNKGLDEQASEKMRNPLERGKNRDKYFEGIEVEEDIHSCLFLQSSRRQGQMSRVLLS